MLAEHDRKTAKKKKQVTPDEALDLAEHDRKKAKAAKRAVGRVQFAIQDQEIMDEEIETQLALVAKKAKTVKQPGVKPSKKTATKKSAAGASRSQRRKKYLA